MLSPVRRRLRPPIQNIHDPVYTMLLLIEAARARLDARTACAEAQSPAATTSCRWCPLAAPRGRNFRSSGNPLATPEHINKPLQRSRPSSTKRFSNPVRPYYAPVEPLSTARHNITCHHLRRDQSGGTTRQQFAALRARRHGRHRNKVPCDPQQLYIECCRKTTLRDHKR